MAEIHIERKRSIWPWVILALVVLAVILWWLYGRTQPEPSPVVTTPPGPAVVAPPAATQPTTPPPEATTTAPPATVTGPVAGAPEPVNDYLRYADEKRAKQAADLTHDYTANGLRRLADALAAIAERNRITEATVDEQLRVMRERAEAMGKDPTATTHAASAREAMVAGATAMQTLQERKFPALNQQVAQAREAATQVRAEGPLLEQTAEVQRFFDRSAEVVRGMATTA